MSVFLWVPPHHVIDYKQSLLFFMSKFMTHHNSQKLNSMILSFFNSHLKSTTFSHFDDFSHHIFSTFPILFARLSPPLSSCVRTKRRIWPVSALIPTHRLLSLTNLLLTHNPPSSRTRYPQSLLLPLPPTFNSNPSQPLQITSIPTRIQTFT